jgi:hypothetical protein
MFSDIAKLERRAAYLMGDMKRIFEAFVKQYPDFNLSFIYCWKLTTAVLQIVGT